MTSTVHTALTPSVPRTLSHAARLLRDCTVIADMDLADWDLAIQQGRRADVLARICHDLEAAGLLSRVPERPANHLRAARILADKHARDIRWEVRCIARALQRIDGPKVLLKGAAYVMAGLPAAAGRMFTDIDLMVAKTQIGDVEQELIHNDWRFHETDAYDQHYYRTWMHQIPPLIHMLRRTVIDIHHTIVPETARPDVNTRKLFEALVPLDGYAGFFVLAPADMVLHSAVHLFNEGEFDHGLRDLSDMDLLLRHFGADAAFWPRLTERARELDLQRPLFYALRHATRVLDTPVPTDILNDVARARPNPVKLMLMDALLTRGLRPHHPSCDDGFSDFARWLLYVRAHYLRMPWHLLLPHLIRKAWKNRFDDE